ncbi:uncharacterized protein A1O9_08156 [Exophiala aquamarina CBS 119918]|uniref:C2H2-type domain-containing protein n=1 Tax=Exophiala aquamarina CBS 119918 TaxID=1182545 RepID=A0A072P6C3_9EURO|nr:uncharacterized protein A1O9_08156 [Exophiala aquamarina CBS 119918]KEF55406.1 hypothetical protein A1O9_08156 [Exophiala aquamarina CBS 119918]
MTKKKRHHPDVEEILARPWCYYCERDFDDLKILINHQKAKHFKCERCGRRLNTAGGLSVHMSQVHKENLTAVDNALPNRAGLDIEIFGMEGIPEDIVQQHSQRVLTTYHQAQAERSAATGNNQASSVTANVNKKPKLEQLSDLKKRLAEHKAAKLAAEQGSAGNSGNSTPVPPTLGQTQSQSNTVRHPQSLQYRLDSSLTQAASPSYPGYQQPYTATPSSGTYSQPPSFAQTQTAGPPYQAPSPFPHAATPPMQGAYGQGAVPPPGHPGFTPGTPVGYPQPYAQPPQASFQQQHPAAYPPQPSFSPPPYQNQPPYPVTGQTFVPTGGLPQPPYVPATSPPGFPHQPQPQNHLPPRTHSPATNGNFPAPVRTGSVSLPNAPGLPQRPAFGAPAVNAFQFQQMHQGQIPAPSNHNSVPQHRPQDAHSSTAQNPPDVQSGRQSIDEANASSIDDLISSASKQADVDAATSTAPSAQSVVPLPSKDDVIEEKGAKKDKEKPKSTRLVYSDNEISPEEKMALLPRYAFTPGQETVVV